MMLTSVWESQRKPGLIGNDWKEALAEIQSQEFAINLNMVSDLRTFLQAASKESVVQTLYTAMSESEDAFDEVVNIIRELSSLEVDRRYENPNDTALAVLLMLVALVNTDFAIIMADFVDRSQQCWYAKKIARQIITPHIVSTSNTQSYIPFSPVKNDVNLIINPIIRVSPLLYGQKTRIGNIDKSGNDSTEVLTWI